MLFLTIDWVKYRIKYAIKGIKYPILTGARQTGKSTLLRQLETYCKELSRPCIFLNLENRDILSILDENPLNLLTYLPNPEDRVFILSTKTSLDAWLSNGDTRATADHSDRRRSTGFEKAAFRDWKLMVAMVRSRIDAAAIRKISDPMRMR